MLPFRPGLPVLLLTVTAAGTGSNVATAVGSKLQVLEIAGGCATQSWVG